MKKELTQVLLFWLVVIAGSVAIAAILSSCKTQRTLAPFVLRDSISITYKQGTLTTPQGITLQVPTTRNNENPNQPSSPRASPSIEQVVRVDTLFVERWHTTEVPSPPEPIPRFYKDCTWGFFILLLLILGRIALRITKAVRLRR